MAQYDLLLTQNTASSGVEFSEKNINLGKGSILSAGTGSVPTALHAGADGYMLVTDTATATGLKWVAVAGGHTQNTDTGTTSAVFELASAGAKIELTAESMTKFGVKVDGGATYADLQAKDATFNLVTLARAPVAGTDAVNKTYADGLAAANDAMIFKGTVGTGGTIEKADLETLDVYNTGWNYKVITAGTYFGNVCQIGDQIMAIETRNGSGDIDADWTVVQANIDGAVIGPSSVTDAHIAQFDGTTGKLLKDGGVLGTMAAEAATDYITKALFDAETFLMAKSDNTPVAIPRTEVATELWAGVPVDKIGTGWSGLAIAGMIAIDANYMYICDTGGTATNQAWVRTPLATNW